MDDSSYLYMCPRVVFIHVYVNRIYMMRAFSVTVCGNQATLTFETVFVVLRTSFVIRQFRMLSYLMFAYLCTIRVDGQCRWYSGG
jgi:hypothetical protein